ncbi:MAG: GNAT family N-acetyltransferase [Anaerolineales bacterium]|nr:GNAT family N-acetyltransferase [Anaerolineales bacterium]
MSKLEIKIRRAEPSDAEALKKIFESPKVIYGTLQLPFPSTENWRKGLAQPQDGAYSLIALVNDEGVGQLGLHTFPHNPRRRHVGQIGMGVRDDWHGKGVGSALMQAMLDFADKWLNLSRLELEVYTDNEAAIHLYKKFGFVTEGTHHRFAYRDGVFVDVYAMARLRTAL